MKKMKLFGKHTTIGVSAKIEPMNQMKCGIGVKIKSAKP